MTASTGPMTAEQEADDAIRAFTAELLANSDVGAFRSRRRRLVDALAAAIEVSEANPEPRSAPLHRLNEALSALREDETWHAS